MSTIACPNCDGTFRSKKDLTGKKVRCPRCDSSFVVEDDAEQVVLPRTAAVAPPRAASPQSRPSPKPKSKKPDRGKKRKATSGGGGFPKPLLICLGIAVAIGAGWYGLQVLNNAGVAIPGLAGGADGQGGAAVAGGGGGGVGLAGMLGMTDTPESLMQDYTDIGKELQQVLASVTDEASVEPAIKSIEGIIWDLVDLRRRAALATPVSKQELHKVLRKFSEDEQAKAADVVKVVEQPPNQVTRYEKIRQALDELTFLARSTQGTIRQGLEELPEPRNDFEEIEHERAGLLRHAMQQVLQVDDSGDVAAAVSAVEETAGNLQALAERKTGMPGVQSRGPHAASRYVAWIVRPSALMDEHVLILRNRSVAVEPLSSALIDLSTANSNVDFASMPGAFSQGPDPAQRSGNPSQPNGGRPMAGPRRGAGRFGPGGGGFGGPPPTKTGPVGSGEVVIVLKGDVFTEQSEDPKEQIVIRQRAFEVLKAAHEVFRQETGIVGSQGRITQGVVTIRGPYDGDPQALAEKFSFGSVESVDSSARQIEVTVSPALVDQVRQSMQQNR